MGIGNPSEEAIKLMLDFYNSIKNKIIDEIDIKPIKTKTEKVKEWLVFACMEAEKELGGKTGQLKLRMVYDMFLSKFNWLAKVVSFEQFFKLVDESLEEFKHLLKSNKAVKNIVAGK